MVHGQAVQCAAYVLMALANSPVLDSARLTFAMMLVQSASSGMIAPARDDARGSYMAVNGLVLQGAKLTGLSGLFLVSRVVLRLEQRPHFPLSHAKGAAD